MMLTNCCIYRVLITLARVVSQVCTSLFVQGISVGTLLGYFLVSQTLLLSPPLRLDARKRTKCATEMSFVYFTFHFPRTFCLSPLFLFHSLPLFASCFRHLTLYSFLGNKKGLKFMKLRNLRFWHFRLKIPNVNGIFPLFPAFFPLFVLFFC